MKLAALSAMFLVFLGGTAVAGPDSRAAALDYEKCIIELRHLSQSDVKSTIQPDMKLEDAANALAEKSVAACRIEKEKLRKTLVSENEMDAQHVKSIQDLEDDSKYVVKLAVLDHALKSKK